MAGYRGGDIDRAYNLADAYFSLPTNHVGGIQVVGKTLATASRHDDHEGVAVVGFYDVTDPANTPADEALFHKVRFGNTRYYGGWGQILDDPHAVAVVRLSRGGYLMAVNQGRSVYLFLTNYQHIRSTAPLWHFHNLVTIHAPEGPENINFVTQCDGTIYFLATANAYSSFGGDAPGTANVVIIYKLIKVIEDLNGNGTLDAGEDLDNDGVLDPPKLDLQEIDTRASFRNDGFADFRAAANFYVSPQGELLLYANSKGPLAENFNLAEFADPNFCPLGGCYH